MVASGNQAEKLRAACHNPEPPPPCPPSVSPSPRRIPTRLELSTKVLDCPERLRSTLAHEMCHVAAWSLDKQYNPHHGPAFWKWAGGGWGAVRYGSTMVAQMRGYPSQREVFYPSNSPSCRGGVALNPLPLLLLCAGAVSRVIPDIEIIRLHNHLTANHQLSPHLSGAVSRVIPDIEITRLHNFSTFAPYRWACLNAA